MTDTAKARKRSGIGGNAWLWLAYTLFLFIDPIVEPGRHILVPTIVVFLLFLPLYFAFIRLTDERVLRTVIALIVLLGALTFPWNSGGLTLFIYAACFLPFCVESTSLVLLFFAFEIALMASETQWIHWHGQSNSWYSVLFNGFLLVVIGGSNIFFAQRMRSDRKLRMAQEEIETLAAVAERERIARDLHDVLGHTLSLIVLKAELAGRLIDRDPARAAVEISEVERTARTALAEVREAIGGYRARDLSAEIENARRTLATAGVELHVEAMDATAAQLSAARETVLALALREAVTNIVRHAEARHCKLSVRIEGEECRLIIEDDGTHNGTREGNGLRGMRERVQAQGGTLLLDRTRGTRLEVGLPGACRTAVR